MSVPRSTRVKVLPPAANRDLAAQQRLLLQVSWPRILTLRRGGGRAMLTPPQGEVMKSSASVQALPVGFVFISVAATNPATLLGYGTWTAFGAGRVLIGLDSGDGDFDAAEETGGAKTVAASAQSFGGNALATHKHAIGTNVQVNDHAANTSGAASAAVAPGGTVPNVATALAHTHSTPALTHTVVNNAGTCDEISGGTPSGTNTPGAATSVVQPYIVVYMWKRTA